MIQLRILLPAVIVFFLFPVEGFSSAPKVYITPDGSSQGACTTGPHTPAWFNSSANWGSGANQIGAGTQVLVCGTFTGTAGNGLLSFQGGGTSGHPILLTCDAGTNLTNPAWGSLGGAAIVDYSGYNYITLNLAGCTIQNTANGTGLTYNQDSTGIYINGSNVTVENGTISNICQHTSVTDHTGCVTSGSLPAAIQTSGSNITVTNMTIHDSAYGIYDNVGTSDSGVVLSNNSIDRCNQHIAVGTAGSGNAITGTKIFGNILTNAVNWDDGVADNFHHNAIFVFQGAGGSISNTLIYNNSIGGDFGVNDTSYIFIDPNGGTITGTIEFNNLLLNGSATNGPANGFITGLGTGTGAAYNNTIFCNGVGQSAIKTDAADIIENNIISTCSTGIYVNNGTILTASNYNVFYNLTGAIPMYYAGTTYASVAAWKAGTGFDANSVTGNPNLNTNGTLQSGSSAIRSGTNLTSLSITALDSDKAGVARPVAGAWNAGGYEVTGPNPPGQLTGTAK